MSDNQYWKTSEDGHFITVPPIEELCASLKYKFLDQEKEIKRVYEENEKLKANLWKDEELQRLKKEKDEMQEELLRGFPMSKESKEKAENWAKKHKCKDPIHLKDISYRFAPIPGIGIMGTIECTCGASYTFQMP